MTCPDWYADWRHEAFHQLQEMNARLSGEFRLGDWPRYDYDLEAGTLIFLDGSAARVVAEIQIAGTTSVRSMTWLWSWANSHLPLGLRTDASLARAFGEQHGITELTDEAASGSDLVFLGWQLTSIAVRIGGALGAYRVPSPDGGGVYFVFRSVGWVN